MKKKYTVRLTETERQALKDLVRKGKVAAYRRTHAQVLLWADESDQEFGLRDAEIAEEVGLRDRTVSRFRQWCVEQGLAAALERPPRKRERLRVQDGEPPPGQSRWTLQMTADRLVELGVVESISHEVVQQVLNKHL